ncbi:helix-turn-helix transcriptional regulator [Streptomyces sp. NPDC086182]|uniref:helix-turn-helix transcriptional regulator n=1 Tax=Streptomyces sp. NPDC086182 TaxID=3155058 RepID=UPI003426FD8D
MYRRVLVDGSCGGSSPMGVNRTMPGAGEGRRESMEESLGKAVRSRRGEAGMTQERLAELSGMTQSAISRLEHGKCMPTMSLLERIAAAFGPRYSW